MVFEYAKCSKCGMIMRIDPDVHECIFCGARLFITDKVTERKWREYWIGIKGQVYLYNDLKETKQEELKGGDINAK